MNVFMNTIPGTQTSRWRAGFLAALIGVVITASAMAFASCGDDDDDDVEAAAVKGDISIIDPTARASEMGTSAVYFTIKNDGDADRLVSASTSAAGEVQLHETVIEGDTAKMQKLDAGIAVPADGEVLLKPGGLHVMLLDLKSPLAAGSSLDVTLVFETAGEVTLSVPIMTMPGMSGGMGTEPEK